MNLEEVKSKYINYFFQGLIFSSLGIINFGFILNAINSQEFSILFLINIFILVICFKKSLKIDDEKIILLNFIKTTTP